MTSDGPDAIQRVAILASGGGRSFENLVERSRAGTFRPEVALVIADRPAGVLDRAQRLGVEHHLLSWRELGAEGFSSQAFERAEAAGCQRVVLAGFLRRLIVPQSWSGRVLNIHPSLLPAFGGKGFFGDHVHRAVLERGVQVTGCTVHLVDDEYDHGSIVLQRWLAVSPEDTVESLAARVFELEKEALPAAIERTFSHPRQAD